jgi:hypothetical protein
MTQPTSKLYEDPEELPQHEGEKWSLDDDVLAAATKEEEEVCDSNWNSAYNNDNNNNENEEAEAEADFILTLPIEVRENRFLPYLIWSYFVLGWIFFFDQHRRSSLYEQTCYGSRGRLSSSCAWLFI